MDKEFSDLKQEIGDVVRTRVAPSPTGYFHIATARTALFNYIFAKQNNGKFILRIEDTDLERSKKEYKEDILENFQWLGIKWDEGPIVGGDYGPYLQSQRLDIYKKHLSELLKRDMAYYCFCSKEDLETQRQYMMSIGRPPIYNSKCGNLIPAEVEEYLAQGKKSIIRFRTRSQNIVFKDLIRGNIEFDTSLIGDFAIAKDLDTPLYNFACAVDDFEMKISHVIRGEDHISNTPKQILIQKALEFPTPKYAHLPIILAPDKTKLSKRHGSVSIKDFKADGYLSETLINFMAFLGWNPGTEQEIFSLNRLIKEFSFKRIKKSGSAFNNKRLDYLNGFYIRQKPLKDLTNLCVPYLVHAGLLEFKSDDKIEVKETSQIIDFNVLEKIISLYAKRLKKLSEVSDLIDFFFKKEIEYDKLLFQWKDASFSQTLTALDKCEEIVSNAKIEWTEKNLKNILLSAAVDFGNSLNKAGDRGYLLWPLRIALTGKRASAEPFAIAEILGKEQTLVRIKKAKENINS